MFAKFQINIVNLLENNYLFCVKEIGVTQAKQFFPLEENIKSFHQVSLVFAMAVCYLKFILLFLWFLRLKVNKLKF